ncbi:MAG: DUF1924 domain-containing protein, partial [Bacteriovorax sp.]
MKVIKSVICMTFATFLLGQNVWANEAVLKELEKEARAADVKFVGFNSSAGEKLFRAERTHSSGEKISCMACHTPDPKKTGLTRANKVIQPLAPVANAERFTDMAKVQKWFKRNCNDVLE